jgi:hypothetical protein
MVEAWPVVVAGDIEGFHKLKDTSWEEFEGGKYLDSYNKAMEASGSVQEEYANEPEEEYQTVDSIIRQGDDLNREKQQYKHSYRNSDNPMAMELDEELASLLDSILVREEMTDVLKAEQPYQDEKTGKMVTPPKGATMPPADSAPAPTQSPTTGKPAQSGLAGALKTQGAGPAAPTGTGASGFPVQGTQTSRQSGLAGALKTQGAGPAAPTGTGASPTPKTTTQSALNIRIPGATQAAPAPGTKR